MKKRIFAIVFGSMMLATVAGAASTGSGTWTGVWQAKLEGQPAVELTLADDAGDVGGTIVFHIVLKEKGATTPHVASTEPHTLINPRVGGDTLTFQVVRGNGSHEVLDMSAQRMADGRMDFRCSNCGSEGTHAELEKVQY
jgi:hypothetical protein